MIYELHIRKNGDSAHLHNKVVVRRGVLARTRNSFLFFDTCKRKTFPLLDTFITVDTKLCSGGRVCGVFIRGTHSVLKIVPMQEEEETAELFVVCI